MDESPMLADASIWQHNIKEGISKNGHQRPSLMWRWTQGLDRWLAGDCPRRHTSFCLRR